MNCRDLDALFENQGNTPLPESAGRHLSTCPECRRLMAVWESARSHPSLAPSNPVTSSKPRLPVDLLENLTPVRPLPRGPLLMLSAVLSAALVYVVVIAWWGRAGWGVQTVVERLILFGTVAAALFTSAYSLSTEMIPGSKPTFNWPWPSATAFAAFVLTVLIAFHHVYRLDMGAIHGECFVRGLLAAAAVLPLLLVSIRRGVFLDRKKVSITIAILIASAALLILTTYCPILNWKHVLLAHLGAVAVIVASGTIIGKVTE